MLIKMKHRWICPSTLTANSVGGIVLNEFKCCLRVGHHGHHRSKDGAIWDNTGKRDEEMEKAMDPKNRPLIVLGARR
jgi:hypothetical protein